MYVRGSDSWKFGHGDNYYLETALLVRDAADLPVPAVAGVPPRLRAGLAMPLDVVERAARVDIAGRWVSWWRQLVGQAACEAGRRWDVIPNGENPRALFARRLAGREQVFDPPGSAHLPRCPRCKLLPGQSRQPRAGARCQGTRLGKALFRLADRQGRGREDGGGPRRSYRQHDRLCGRAGCRRHLVASRRARLRAVLRRRRPGSADLGRHPAGGLQLLSR